MANNRNQQPNQNDERRTQQGGGRGFAGMDQERQRQIASKGGQSVPAEERSFSRDRNLASEAGRKGGENSHGSRRNTSDDTSGTRQFGGPAARRHQDTDFEW